MAFIMEMMRHFMGWSYSALYTSKRRGWASLRSCEKAVLVLFQTFLYHTSYNGILRSDASLFGLIGYNISTGMARRIELPIDYHLCTSLNSLEFLSAYIVIWMEHANCINNFWKQYWPLLSIVQGCRQFCHWFTVSRFSFIWTQMISH